MANFTSRTLAACGMADFGLVHAAPVFGNGWAYLGEPAKFVPVAEARTRSISEDAAGVSVELRGAAGEEVELAFYAPNGTVMAVDCVLDEAGAATARAANDMGGCL